MKNPGASRPSPRVNISLSYDDMGKKAAREIANLLRKKPNAVLGFATGSTPLSMYRELIRMHQKEALDFSKATFFNLDEYVDLPRDHPQSYRNVMQETLFCHINADPSRIHIPNSHGEEWDKECSNYERKIRAAGGIDLQVLGIGENGHIGFSEPGTPFDTPTHVTELTQETREANKRFFDNDIDKVPTHALTMGPATIMQTKRVLLLASGAKKMDAAGEAITGPVTPDLPASILQNHPDATFFLDRNATRGFEKYFVPIER